LKSFDFFHLKIFTCSSNYIKEKNLEHEIDGLKQKRTFCELQKSADVLKEKAAKTKSMLFLHSQNSFNMTVIEKIVVEKFN